MDSACPVGILVYIVGMCGHLCGQENEVLAGPRGGRAASVRVQAMPGAKSGHGGRQQLRIFSSDDEEATVHAFWGRSGELCTPLPTRQP